MKMGWSGLYRDKNLLQAALLSLLMLVACGYCLYQFSQVKKNVQRLGVLNDQMRVIRQLQARLPPEAAPRERLPERLRQSAQVHRITLSELTESQEGVWVTLPAVPFERLLLWLAALQREQGIRVQELTADRGELPPGVVQVSRLLVATQPGL